MLSERDRARFTELVDGQHRGGAVKLLMSRKRIGDDFPVPVKIMLGFERAEEIKQFYYINSQGKNVPTDLTAELLQRMARQDSDEAEYLSERMNKGRLLAGAAVYDALVKNKSPWIQRIRRPNEPASKDTSIAVSTSTRTPARSGRSTALSSGARRRSPRSTPAGTAPTVWSA